MNMPAIGPGAVGSGLVPSGGVNHEITYPDIVDEVMKLLDADYAKQDGLNRERKINLFYFDISRHLRDIYGIDNIDHNT